MQGNVTFDPLAFAEPVLNPEITEILDLESGEFLDVATFISRSRYDRLVAERVSIRENLANKPRFGCALCATPVYLVASREKRFFFRHCREDGSCPSITRSGSCHRRFDDWRHRSFWLAGQSVAAARHLEQIETAASRGALKISTT